jgi:LysM repeat protein
VQEEPAEPAPSEPETYIVQSGDYLLKIARQLDLDWARLARFNELAPPFALHPGDALTLPGEDAVLPELDLPKTYTAARSESLVAIAHYYGLDWVALAAMNELPYPYLLAPGQTVRLR